MRRHAGSSVIFGVLVALLVTGCAQPPLQQLEETEKAVGSARGAGGPDYAKEDFIRLEEAFSQAKQELANQEKTLAIFRSYRKADQMLKNVMKDAKQVEAAAVAKKDEARNAAIKGEKEAQAAVASAEELLTQAPAGKDRAVVESIKNDLNGMRSNLEAIRQKIKEENYLEAQVQAKAVKEEGVAVSAEIQKAIDKARGARTKPIKRA